MHGGSGIKPFIDLYLIKNAISLNQSKLLDFLKKGKLEEFYYKIMHFIEVWFDEKEYDEFSLLLEDYVLLGGVYGSAEQQNAVASIKTKKRSGLIKKVFLPYKTLKEYYPILNKLAILYPFCVVIRLFRVLFNKERLNRAKKEIKASLDEDKKQKIEKLFKELNI